VLISTQLQLLHGFLLLPVDRENMNIRNVPKLQMIRVKKYDLHLVMQELNKDMC